MIDEEFDWNKHMKVFTQEVGVKVKKNVTRQDVLLSLLNDDEIAFKIKDGGHFILQLNKNWAKKDVLDTLIINPIKERAKKLEDADVENSEHSPVGSGNSKSQDEEVRYNKSEPSGDLNREKGEEDGSS